MSEPRSVFYVANARMPTERAHGIQIAKTCEALGARGVKVELIVPRRKNAITEDLFEYYDVKRTFSVRYLPVLDLVSWGRVGFWVSALIFAELAFWYLVFRTWDAVYGRDEVTLAALALFRKKVLYEAHTNRLNLFVRQVLKSAAGVVTVTENLRQFYIERGGREDAVHVVRNGVDLSRFGITQSRTHARAAAGLPDKTPIALYTGHLYGWKGAHVLAEAARYLPETLFVFVGGTVDDVQRFQAEFKTRANVLAVGHKSHKEIPTFLAAADVLVVPNIPETQESTYYTAPIKLFEYLASGTPVVASDLPSIREVVDEKTAFLAKSADAYDLSVCISEVLDSPEEATRRAARARELSKTYSWERRAARLVELLQAA